MKKRMLAALAAVAAIAVLFTGCAQFTEALGGAVANVFDGDGKVGQTYETQWFDFTINSISRVDTYANYTAAPGHTLIDVVITERGTYDDPSFMGTFDFQIVDSNYEGWYEPLEAADHTMMPAEFYLAQNETVQYHMVYEVPSKLKDLRLIYIEVDNYENEGQSYTVKIAD